MPRLTRPEYDEQITQPHVSIRPMVTAGFSIEKVQCSQCLVEHIKCVIGRIHLGQGQAVTPCRGVTRTVMLSSVGSVRLILSSRKVFLVRCNSAWVTVKPTGCAVSPQCP